MGAAAASIVIGVALAASNAARAEPCTGVTPNGGRFALCFDRGNRLSLTAGTNGFGGSIAIRHTITFEDEPDLEWKMEHVIADATHAAFTSRFTGLLYRGRYLRHARDGHIVLPLGTPKKIFLPFDVGGLVEVGNVHWRPSTPTTMFGVVKTVGLVDLSRSRDSRRRLAFGPVASWDIEMPDDRMLPSEHYVAAFTSLLVDLHAESSNGRLAADLRGEAGYAWHSLRGWITRASAEAALERIILAVNDRPIALYGDVRYESDNDEVTAGVGVRIVLVDRSDPRVSLKPLKTTQKPPVQVPKPARPSTSTTPPVESEPAGLPIPPPCCNAPVEAAELFPSPRDLVREMPRGPR